MNNKPTQIRLTAKEKENCANFLEFRKMENSLRKTTIDELKAKRDEISELRLLLADNIVDEGKTLLGGEPVFKPLFNDKERVIIKAILFEKLKNF